MWNKEQQPSPSSQPAGQQTATATAPAMASSQPAAGSAGVTMIGESLRIQGTLTSNEEIVVNGELSGQLHMNHRLTIGAKGKVEAGVHPKEGIIAGSLKGKWDAAERITLRAGAKLAGAV